MHKYKLQTSEKPSINEKLLEIVIGQIKGKEIPTCQSRSKAIEDA